MSLEQQISELVSATNDLTNEVVGQMGAIEQKADDTANAILNNIGQVLSPIAFYVDAVSGSDSHPGTSAEPFATLKRAMDAVPMGIYGRVWLKAGQTHLFNQSVAVMHKHVTVLGSWGAGDFAVLDCPAFNNDSYNNMSGQIALYSGSLRFRQLTINLHARVEPALPWSNQRSLVNPFGTWSGLFAVSLRQVTVHLTDGNALVRNHVGGVCQIGCYGLALDGNGYLVCSVAQGTVSFGHYQLTLANGAKVCDSGVLGQNILSSYTGSGLV